MDCYIVGSGNSLDMDFLDSIQDKFSFSCNAIGSIYDRTNWRPTIYTLTSINFENSDRRLDFIKSMQEVEIIFANQDYAIDYNLDAHPLVVKEFPSIRSWKPDWFSPAPLKWVSKYGTSLLPCVQLAFWMGFKHIIFVGCDGYNRHNKTQHVEGYPTWADKFNVIKPSKSLRGAHELISYHAKQRGIKISFEGDSQFAELYD